MPHIEALHHICGLGIAEIRTDTYILSTNRRDWLIIIRGGTRFEIKVKTGMQELVSAWQTPVRTSFPLPRSVVRMLQDAFPNAELPRKISAPVDLISWLGPNASVCTVSKRMVRFRDDECTAELAQVDIKGRRTETFCLRARRPRPVLETLAMMPGPPLPNLDYGAWIQRRITGPLPAPVPAPAPPVAQPAELVADDRPRFARFPIRLHGPNIAAWRPDFAAAFSFRLPSFGKH